MPLDWKFENVQIPYSLSLQPNISDKRENTRIHDLKIIRIVDFEGEKKYIPKTSFFHCCLFNISRSVDELFFFFRKKKKKIRIELIRSDIIRMKLIIFRISQFSLFSNTFRLIYILLLRRFFSGNTYSLFMQEKMQKKNVSW